MEIKEFINKNNLPEILKIYEEVKEEYGKPNITYTAKRFCEYNGYVYSDGVRRRLSNLLERNTRIEESTKIKAIHKENNKAKVLFFDIETSLMEALVFSPYKNYRIPLTRITKDWNILCFSAQWIGSQDIIKYYLTEEELKESDERRIVKELWKLLDEAQIVIAHNGLFFDIPKANAKFLEYGLGLPSPYQVIDTYRLAKKSLAPTSLSLDYLSKLLGRTGKDESYGLWDRIAKGEYEALLEMVKYCDGDIRELREIFFELRPYLKGLPNMGLFTLEETSCTACGSTDFMSRKTNAYRTSVNEFETMQCACCGSYSKSRTATKKKTVGLTPIYR